MRITVDLPYWPCWTPCCPPGTKMPRLAQHEACEGTNGGVFFWPWKYHTFCNPECVWRNSHRKNCFFGYIPSFLVIFCWGVSQFGLTIAPQFGRSDGKPVTLRSNRWELSIVYGSTFAVTFGWINMSWSWVFFMTKYIRTHIQQV